MTKQNNLIHETSLTQSALLHLPKQPFSQYDRPGHISDSDRGRQTWHTLQSAKGHPYPFLHLFTAGHLATSHLTAGKLGQTTWPGAEGKVMLPIMLFFQTHTTHFLALCCACRFVWCSWHSVCCAGPCVRACVQSWGYACVCVCVPDWIYTHHAWKRQTFSDSKRNKKAPHLCKTSHLQELDEIQR